MMTIPIRSAQALILVIALLTVSIASGCTTARETEPAYDLAQRCFAVQADATGRYLAAGSDGRYTFSAGDVASAEAFFFKPTSLGTFMLHDSDGRYLGIQETATRRVYEIRRLDAADPRVEWKVVGLDIRAGLESAAPGSVPEAYSLVANLLDHRLFYDEAGTPSLAPRRSTMPAATAALQLVERPAEACRAFPEASLNADVAPGFDDAQPATGGVVGYADIHTHLSFPRAMAGLVMAGAAFDRFGVERALPDCSELHGANGTLDYVGLTLGLGRHATAGYPDLTDWPTREKATHTQTYYRWIQRAYLSGLRLLVTNVTGERILCQIVQILHLGGGEGDCSPKRTLELQLQFLFDLQDYIDAQAGGPGEGWFRIVTSPTEARAVIAANKLAVVLGVEYGALFDCREGQPQCTEAYIDEQVARLYDMGVRSVFPMHRMDNAFGGARISNGTRETSFENLASKLETGAIDHLLDVIDPSKLLFEPSFGGHFYDYEACPEGVLGSPFNRNLREFIGEIKPFPDPVLNELANIFFFDKLEPIPTYDGFTNGESACNARHLQPLGRRLISDLIDRGMLVEVDHMGHGMLLDTLDLVEARGYSGVVSSHGWIENSPALRARIFALGGLVAPRALTAAELANGIATYADEMSAYPWTVGIAVGTDVQGLTSLPEASPGPEVTYPFTSYDGLVSFSPPVTGNRAFDYMSEGVAHYGLMPEWIEQVRRIGEEASADLMTPLMNSAEAYLQMWERAETGVP
ncbi:MAG: hypothetical protein KC466_04740 [Myxococcales bacterium]|nr:hypothetical protein [Myxococcales bacterium]